MQERKLAAWVEAGVVDAETARRIRAFEASHARPLALWAVIGIAALAIGLGIVSVVAANWDAIPAMVRLGVHLALLTGITAALWLTRGRGGWVEEALLFVFGALGLSFMGHLGQAYQTTSPLWQPLALWLVLLGPLFLARGQAWLTALGFAGVLVVAVWSFAADFESRGGGSFLIFALPTALPLLLAPLGAAMRVRSARAAFWRRLEELGFVYALGGASIVAMLTGVENLRDDPDAAKVLSTMLVWAAVGAGSAALVWRSRSDRSGKAAAGIMVGASAVVLLGWPLSGNQVIGALLFMALWAGVAAMALRGGWRGVFQLSIAVLALRLIVLSFELEDDLLSSGAGLIAAGLLILGIAWIAVRVARKYAPPEEEAP